MPRRFLHFKPASNRQVVEQKSLKVHSLTLRRFGVISKIKIMNIYPRMRESGLTMSCSSLNSSESSSKTRDSKKSSEAARKRP